MLVHISCLDRPDAGDLRPQTRARHLEFLSEHAGRIRFAGPLLDQPAGRAIGTVVIADFADLDEAEAFCAADPYTRAGLFARVEIHALRQVLPAE